MNCFQANAQASSMISGEVFARNPMVWTSTGLNFS
jgi:hypothetical protein